AMNGHTDIVNLLLETGKMEYPCIDDRLQYASLYGLPEDVKLILEVGADPAANDHQAFRWACRQRYFDIVNILLESG
ncbi:hypothetical protein BDR26DRAFT_790435, partial [Obelidium mucronatum]